MLRRRLYYAVKPFVPWRLRMAIRGVFARRKRKQFESSWPIDPTSARPPEGWPGWPGGKKFAFVISHDVEGTDGLAKCQKLAELEKSLGFRSSFNLIPEGPYSVPDDLRNWLTGNDFEVGIHDLHHDGKLFSSRQGFLEKAARINQYAKDWKAIGYRSGFMLRNLDWLHDLEVTYDASTFDTDPFEPQPDGVGSIFPFWIPRPTRQHDSSPPAHRDDGYVELPYTLPQDSTLFLLLGEKTPEIWIRKLDWVARHGGMALVNVHPDYLRFDGEARSPRTFPVSLYEQLLRHVLERHRDDAWLATPREIALHVRSLRPRPLHRRPLRVCMVTHSFYETDTRVIRYAEALVDRGDHVDVLGLGSESSLPRLEKLNGVNHHRLQVRTYRAGTGPLGFLFPILRFLVRSAWWIARSPHTYDVYHIHNVPDFLIFAALGPRLRGARVILDIHDLVPEFYASKFGLSGTSLVVRLLQLSEKISAKIADHVIIANDLWLERYQQRTGTTGRCSVFINNVDERLFRARPRTRSDNRKILLFPGGLQPHQGLDIAIRAMPAIIDAVPTAELHIHGEGSHKPVLEALVRELGLKDRVRFFPFRPTSEIVGVMADADLGVVPKRADSFGNEAYSTKIMEFLALGVPVVASETKIDRHYFTDDVLRFFCSGDDADLARKAIEVLTQPSVGRELSAAGARYASANCWGQRKAEYLALVDGLGATRSR